MKDQCECGRKAILVINVTKADGELIDRVHLCDKCGLHKKTIEALADVYIRIDASMFKEKP